jgi:hypothetical protein
MAHETRHRRLKLHSWWIGHAEVILLLPHSASTARNRSKHSATGKARLLQFRALRLGLLQDGDVGVGVFPESKEILVRGAGLYCVTSVRVGTRQTQSR